jgi:hypothetical protein
MIGAAVEIAHRLSERRASPREGTAGQATLQTPDGTVANGGSMPALTVPRMAALTYTYGIRLR